MAFFEFPHTRTYDSDLAWLIKAYKILTGKVDNIEQTIEDTINDALKGEELNQLITQLIAESLLLNVKYPPAESGLTPAVGDGETDDTAALQAMIAYSSAHDMPLLFPAGTYRVSGLNVDVDTVFIGFASTLMLMNVSSAPLLNVSAKFVCFGMTLNANIGGQTQPQNVISCTSGRFIIDHCHISSGLSGITGNVTGDCRLVNSEISNFSEYGLYLEGTGRIVSTGVDIPNIASGGALRFIRLNLSNSYIDAWESVAEISVGVEITGDNNYVSVNFPNVETPVNDGGQNNNWKVIGKSEKQFFNGQVQKTCENMNITVEGDLSVSSSDITINADNKTETIKQKKTVSANEIDISSNNDMKFNSSASIDLTSDTEVKLKSNDVILNPINPLTYKTPSPLNKFFNNIDFKDDSGNPYKVLVQNENTDTLGEAYYIETKNYNPIGDGTLHTLSERFSTLEAAQEVYPCATEITNSIDWCAIQQAILDGQNANRPVLINIGNYVLHTFLIVDNSQGLVDIRGEQIQNTILQSPISVMYIKGSTAPSLYRTFETIGNFVCNHYGPGTYVGNGVQVEQCAYIHLFNIYCNNFATGFELSGVEHSFFERIQGEACGYGFRAPQVNLGEMTALNNVTFYNCIFGGNDVGGLVFQGCDVTLIGCSIENNTTAGLQGIEMGYQGGVGFNLIGCYFENNTNQGHISVDRTGFLLENDIAMNVIGSVFNFTSGSNLKAINYIGVSRDILNIIGCGFNFYPGYTIGTQNIITVSNAELNTEANASNMTGQISNIPELNDIGKVKYTGSAFQYWNGSAWTPIS